MTEATPVKPLAAASERLKGRPGRPRKANGPQARQTGALSGERIKTGVPVPAVPELCPVTPRLLDVDGAAAYLGVSPWTVRDLDAAGHLPRVRLPLPGGKELRRLLYDRSDLDRLIDRSKDS